MSNQSNNYIVEWYNKFGEKEMREWMNRYHITVDSSIFKFQPSHVLDKIKKEDLMAFGEYVGDFSTSNIVSYYSTKVNNFYQEKNKHEIEVDETSDEFQNDDELLELIWDNVQDMSVSISQLAETMKYINNIVKLSEETKQILTKLNEKKVEKNAKFYQIEELKSRIDYIVEQIPVQESHSHKVKTTKDEIILKIKNKDYKLMVLFLVCLMGGVLLWSLLERLLGIL